MKGAGKGKKQPVPPVAANKSIFAAFARQNKGKKCPICGDSVQIALYREHVDECNLKLDDSDCEVIQVLTGVESRAIKAGSPIDLLDDNENNPQNQAAAENEDDVPTDNICTEPEPDDPQDRDATPPPMTSSSVLPPRRRSARILGEAAVKVEQPTPPPVRQVNAKKRRAAPTSSSVGNDAPVQPKSTRPRRNVVNRSSTPPAPLPAQARVPPRSPSIAPPTPDASSSSKIETRVKKELPTTAYLIEKIDTILLETSPPADLDATVVSMVSPDEVDNDPAAALGAPYFVTFVLRIIRRVLSTPASNGIRYDSAFWDDDVIWIDRFLQLSSLARQLFMRMFLRKRAWLTSERLTQRYPELADSLDASLQDLLKLGFVDSGAQHLSVLDEALRLLPLVNMKTVAKKFQLDITKGKLDLTISMVSFAANQKGIFGQAGAVEKRMLHEVKKVLGPCYRVNESGSRLLKALFTLYCPSETNSTLAIDKPSINIEQAMLFLMLKVETGAVRFPAPSPCPQLIGAYKDKKELMMYVEAKELEISILSLMSYNKMDEAVEVGNKARNALTMGEEARLIPSTSLLPAPIRRFTAPWVLTRCVSHLSSILEKQKKFALAIHTQRFLLKTNSLKAFCMDSRGSWWDRVALNLESHMKEKEEALDEINEGLRDERVADKDKLLLQDRALRITKQDFLEQIFVTAPVKRQIYGVTMSKDIGDARVNRFVMKQTNGDFEECSVEEVCRKHYIDNEGFDRGVHAEGSIWHTVMGLLFDDVIFDHQHEGAWLSELQQSPLDLNTRDFFERRREVFEQRLTWLESADTTESEIEERVRDCWRRREGETNSEMNWELFESVDDCCSFVLCCPRTLLHGVFSRILRDYRNTRSGFPDLTVWDTNSKTVAVVEVKGPGDRLSTKQRLWLHHFRQFGARAEVCHVMANNDKRLS